MLERCDLADQYFKYFVFGDSVKHGFGCCVKLGFACDGAVKLKFKIKDPTLEVFAASLDGLAKVIFESSLNYVFYFIHCIGLGQRKRKQ